MWEMNVYDSPEDIAAEIKEHMDDWLAGFDLTCNSKAQGKPNRQKTVR